MNTVIKYYMPTIILFLLLLISCNPQFSKEEKRRISELRHYLLDSPVNINPNLAKAGGLQSQGVKGEFVVVYLDPLTTQDLKSMVDPKIGNN